MCGCRKVQGLMLGCRGVGCRGRAVQGTCDPTREVGGAGTFILRIGFCSAGGGYMLQLECSRLLLALFSSVLYVPNARGMLGQHPYLDAAMQQNDLANSSEWPAWEGLGGWFPLSLLPASMLQCDGTQHTGRAAAAPWLPCRGPLRSTQLPAAQSSSPAAVEALLRLFIAAPPLPLSQKIFNYMPTDTRSVLRIVRTAAGKRGGAAPARK